MHTSMIISVPAIKIINVIVVYWFKLQNINVFLDLLCYVLIQVRSYSRLGVKFLEKYLRSYAIIQHITIIMLFQQYM